MKTDTPPNKRLRPCAETPACPAKIDVLILDDWGMQEPTESARGDLLNCWSIASAADRPSPANSLSSTGING